MKKILVILLIVLVVLGVATWFYADSAVEAAIEEGGTYALGVETRVGSASIGLFSGTFALDELEIDNPDGYKGQFLGIGDFDIDVETGSAFSDTFVIREIAMDDIAILLEQRSSGSNYGAILDHLKKFESEGSSETPEAESEGESGSGTKVDIDTIRIRNVSARVRLALGEKSVSDVELTVPEILMQDVGSDLTISQVYDRVVKAILAAVLEGGANVLPSELLQGLRADLDELQAVPAQVVGEVQKQVDEAAKQVGEQVGEIEKRARGALESIQGALGGSKQDDK